MSRFGEGDGWEDEADEKLFWEEMRAAYKTAREDLVGFLAYLDAMPAKRIIESRFMDPKTGDKCSVAAFCDYKRVPKLEMLKTEGQSYYERLESGDYERDPKTKLPTGTEEADGWEGATVSAGTKAGLPQFVAYNLAWKNDMVWDTIACGSITWPGVQCTYELNAKGHEVPKIVPCGERGTHWYRQPYVERLYRRVTPEERWQMLRDHVEKQIVSTAVRA